MSRLLAPNIFRCMYGCAKPIPGGSRHWHMCRYHPEKHGPYNLDAAVGDLAPKLLQLTQKARAATFVHPAAANDGFARPITVQLAPSPATSPVTSPSIMETPSTPAPDRSHASHAAYSQHQSHASHAAYSQHQFLQCNQAAGHQHGFCFTGAPMQTIMAIPYSNIAIPQYQLCYVASMPSPFPMVQSLPLPSFVVPFRVPWSDSFSAAPSAMFPHSLLHSSMPVFRP